MTLRNGPGAALFQPPLRHEKRQAARRPVPPGLLLCVWLPWRGAPLRRLRHRLSLPSNRRITRRQKRENAMSWTTPTLVEICVGLEINGYLPAEF